MKRSSEGGGVGVVRLKDQATPSQLEQLKLLKVEFSGPISAYAARVMIIRASADARMEQNAKTKVKLAESNRRALEELKQAGLASGLTLRTEQHPGIYLVQAVQDDPPRVFCQNPRGVMASLFPRYIIRESLGVGSFKVEADQPGHHSLPSKFCTRCGDTMLRSEYPGLKDRKWSMELVCVKCVMRPSWERPTKVSVFCEKCGTQLERPTKTDWCRSCFSE